MTNLLQNFIDFVNSLHDMEIPYDIKLSSDESLEVLVHDVSRYWEIIFYADGRIEGEVFETNHTTHQAEILNEVLMSFSSEDE